MIGSITRALVGVPNEFHSVVLDVVNNLSTSVERAAWHARLEEVLREGLVDAKALVKNLFEKVLEVTLHASPEKLTAECFTNRLRYYPRDGDLDKRLPKSQPAQAKQEFRAQELTREASFLEMVKNIFSTDGTVASYSRLLIEGGHIVTLPKIEELIDRQEGGEDVGLKTNGYANLFFVLNDDGTVSVVRVFRCDGQWYVRVFRLDDARRWDAESHVFLRNS